MIADPTDPHRGRRGRHHDRQRSTCAAADILAISRIAALRDGCGDGERAEDIARHLAEALSCEMMLLRPSSGAAGESELQAGICAVDLAVAAVGEREIGAACRTIRRLAEATARPWLAVPPSARRDTGTRVLALCDRSRLAAACVRDARPLLRDAERIDLSRLDADRSSEAYLDAQGYDIAADDFDFSFREPDWPDLVLVGFSPDDGRAREATHVLARAMRGGACALFSS